MIIMISNNIMMTGLAKKRLRGSHDAALGSADFASTPGHNMEQPWPSGAGGEASGASLATIIAT